MTREVSVLKSINLAGIWKMKSVDGKMEADVPLPGDTHSGLLTAGIIKDPYWETEELNLQRLGRTDWEFIKNVEISEDFLTGSEIYLRLESVDTVCDIVINGEPAGSFDNMFFPADLRVTGLVKPGQNEIRVKIYAAETEAQKRASRLPYPVPHTTQPVQSMHRNLVRKVQCHSGWDWGPCLMVSGVYGRMMLEARETGYTETVSAVPVETGEDLWRVDVSAVYHAVREDVIPFRVVFQDNTVITRKIPVRPGENRIEGFFTCTGVERWWPAGEGGQKLYPVNILVGEDETAVQTGFRSLEVITREDDAGLSMSFRINGRDIFCKGANWIPLDALPSRQTEDRYEYLLKSMVEANMNMVRIWGGGQYEQDIFYELCDRLGIMIWHDMMFACALYPTDGDFLSSVRTEVSYQVRRLKTHPSIVLWCGNNENLGALKWFEESVNNRDRYLVDYDRLNEGAVGNTVRQEDPSRSFWPSSPCGGPGDYSDNWHDDSRGDMHYWSVWHSGKDFSAYYDVIPRFCSEFGFQSYPSMESVTSFAREDSFNPTAPVMEHHQRHRRGNTIIFETICRYYRIPKGFPETLYLSQVQQAEAIKTAVEYWRSNRPLCMGAVYWQLNDLWPVSSWSSIEYNGRWKLLHYAAKRFFEPLHPAAFTAPDGSVNVYLLNDYTAPCSGTMNVRFIRFSGEVLSDETYPADCGGGAVSCIKTVPPDDFPDTPENIFCHIEFKSDNYTAENTLFLVPPKRSPLEKARITWSTENREGREAVVVQTDKPVFHCFFDAPGGHIRFDENGVTILPGEAKVLPFRRITAGKDDPVDSMVLYHLRETY